MKTKLALSLFLLALCTPLHPYTSPQQQTPQTAEQLVVHLRNPVYEQDTLSTTEGGLVELQDFRLQAQTIRYTKTASVSRVEAEGDLMLETRGMVFVAQKLEYDFKNNNGMLYDATTRFNSWYFNGDRIELQKDGSVHIPTVFITQDETQGKEWGIEGTDFSLQQGRIVRAKDIKILFLRIPIFWLPSLKGSVESIFDLPLQYDLHFGGGKGTRLIARYRFLNGEKFRAFFRADLHLKRGIGGGVETEWKDGESFFFTQNHIAYDSSIHDTRTRRRYRFMGEGHTTFSKHGIQADLSYDKVSDRDMVTDYYDKNFNLENIRPTKLTLYKQQQDWIASLTAKARLNPFLTTTTELPTVGINWRPYALGRTGIISESRLSIGYLDYKFASGRTFASDYHTTRITGKETLYKPLPIGPCTLTPSASFAGLLYNNSPAQEAVFQPAGIFSCGLHTDMTRNAQTTTSHTVRPYTRYTYVWTSPNKLREHYIFSQADVYAPLNVMRFGVMNSIYRHSAAGLRQPLYCDLYADAFFRSHTVSRSIPKLNLHAVWQPLSIIAYHLNTGWDWKATSWDRFNHRVDWTVSDNAAIGAEYRQRGPRDWLKADPDNLFLEAFHKESVLLNSPLSNAQRTFLMRFFYRFYPGWSIKVITRHGWASQKAPSFNEWKTELATIVKSIWEIQLFYQYTVAEKRIGINVSLAR